MLGEQGSFLAWLIAILTGGQDLLDESGVAWP